MIQVPCLFQESVYRINKRAVGAIVLEFGSASNLDFLHWWVVQLLDTEDSKSGSDIKGEGDVGMVPEIAKYHKPLR